MKYKIKEGIEVLFCNGYLMIEGHQVCEARYINKSWFEPIPLRFDDLKAGDKFAWGSGFRPYIYGVNQCWHIDKCCSVNTSDIKARAEASHNLRIIGNKT
jgi:hypothetical protein